jgi:hypothetical protein
LNRYKSNKPNEFLIVPESLNRGNIRAKDLTNATTAEECAQLITKWADEVYQSWSSNHAVISQIADGFLATAIRR